MAKTVNQEIEQLEKLLEEKRGEQKADVIRIITEQIAEPFKTKLIDYLNQAPRGRKPKKKNVK